MSHNGPLPPGFDHWLKVGGRISYLSLKNLISYVDHFVTQACGRITGLSEISLQNLYRPQYGELMSPFEMACYYGNVPVLEHIMQLSGDYPIPLTQINAAFSHALWHNHPDTLVFLLNHFSFEFDAGQFEKLKELMQNHVPLRNIINELNQRDFGYAKSLSLLSNGTFDNQNLVPYICSLVSTVHESRGAEILNALRHYNAKLKAKDHEEKLQAYKLRQLSM